MNFTSNPFERMMKEVPWPGEAATIPVPGAATIRSAEEKRTSAARSSGRWW